MCVCVSVCVSTHSGDSFTGVESVCRINEIMGVCVCVYAYICVCICVHVCIYSAAKLSGFVYRGAAVYQVNKIVCMCIYVHICIYTYTYVYVHTSVYICVYILH